MTSCTSSKRWPVVYDSVSLKEQIKRIKDKSEAFYQSSFFTQDILCQGDVIHLEKDFLHFNESGKPALLENPTKYWVVLGNTCDLQRELTDIKYTQIIPLQEINNDIDPLILSNLKEYQSFKKFFYQEINDKIYMIDFTEVTTIHKDALISAKKIKELSYLSWLLFHCCLIRYLARDDGRNDS